MVSGTAMVLSVTQWKVTKSKNRLMGSELHIPNLSVRCVLGTLGKRYYQKL
jgi:hypothetical protein